MTSSSSSIERGGFVEVKSKFDAEFRRFSVDRGQLKTFEAFHALLEDLPSLHDTRVPFIISYIDPKDHDLLPINNTDNFQRALSAARPLLRLVVQRQGEREETLYTSRHAAGAGAGVGAHSVLGKSMISFMGGGAAPKSVISISQPSEFRQVCAIIDVDVVPETCRRVRLLKHGSDKPLGFYIRDGE